MSIPAASPVGLSLSRIGLGALRGCDGDPDDALAEVVVAGVHSKA